MSQIKLPQSLLLLEQELRNYNTNSGAATAFLMNWTPSAEDAEGKVRAYRGNSGGVGMIIKINM
jgi:hypothetical protein